MYVRLYIDSICVASKCSPFLLASPSVDPSESVMEAFCFFSFISPYPHGRALARDRRGHAPQHRGRGSTSTDPTCRKAVGKSSPPRPRWGRSHGASVSGRWSVRGGPPELRWPVAVSGEETEESVSPKNRTRLSLLFCGCFW